jgi:hypothetical protein
MSKTARRGNLAMQIWPYFISSFKSMLMSTEIPIILFPLDLAKRKDICFVFFILIQFSLLFTVQFLFLMKAVQFLLFIIFFICAIFLRLIFSWLIVHYILLSHCLLFNFYMDFLKMCCYV